MACSSTAQEAVWLRRFVQYLGVVAYAFDLVAIHCDSIAALIYVKDLKYHGKIKYIDIKYYHVHEAAKQKEVVLEHASMICVVVDPLTKLIHRDVFLAHVRSLGLCRVWLSRWFIISMLLLHRILLVDHAIIKFNYSFIWTYIL